MAASWKVLTSFVIRLPNKPGELARLLELLAREGVDMQGLWGITAEDGHPRFACVPGSPDKFRSFLGTQGIEVEEGRTFFLSGEDRPGALVDTLKRIGDARINLDAIECVGTGDRFGCFIWADEQFWPALDEILA